MTPSPILPASLMQPLFAILAFAGGLFMLWVVIMTLAARASDEVADTVDDLYDRLGRFLVPAAFIVAMTATLGSLYFSESVGYEPCRLCWYQRIAMYPLVPILGVAVIRRDQAVRRYALPLSIIGSLIAGYHYLLEWFPSLDTGTCKVGIPCSAVWFREFGFVSIPFLALTAFLLITTLLLLVRRDEPPVAAGSAA